MTVSSAFKYLLEALGFFSRELIFAAGHVAGGHVSLLKISRREAYAMEQQTFIKEEHCLERVRARTISGSGDTCYYKNKKPDLGCLALGQLLWAKANRSSWWPAQIVDERTVSENNIVNQRIQGGVLVRFYGSYDFAWVDPLADISQFEESFKGKSINTRTAFQKALEEALLRNKMMNSCEKWNGRSEYSRNPFQPNQSGEKPAQKASSCEKIKGDEHEQSKGARKRKGKIPSDEKEIIMVASEQKVRRMRVMRHLGLAAPPGSPFSPDSSVKIAV